jgi:hypothetical protein
VTGDPAPPLTVAHALLAAAQAQLGLPALGLGVAATWPPLSPLPMGSAAHIGAVIESDHGPRPAAVGVPAEMRSVALPWEDAQMVALSNLPEAVTRPGALAAAVATGGESLRVMYHHLNASPHPLLFAVTLHNQSPGTDRVWLAWASAAASSPLDAGHLAMRDFAGQHVRGAGAIVDLPAGRSLGLDETIVPPGHVLSGVAQVRLLMGAQVCVTVQAGPPPDASLPAPCEGPPADMLPGALPLQAVDVADGRHGFVSIGREPVPYGIAHRYVVHVVNPAHAPAAAVVILHADAGPARAALEIDGRLIDTPVALPGDPVPVARIPLSPCADRRIPLAVMPEAGSSYPVTLEISSEAPSSAVQDCQPAAGMP